MKKLNEIISVKEAELKSEPQLKMAIENLSSALSQLESIVDKDPELAKSKWFMQFDSLSRQLDNFIANVEKEMINKLPSGEEDLFIKGNEPRLSQVK